MPTYTASTAVIPNPERGWFLYTDTHYKSGTTWNALSGTDVANARTGAQSINGSSFTGRTLVFRYYFIEQFLNADLNQDFLDKVAADIVTARNNGAKMIIRFAYSDVQGAGDATPARVQGHITQLAPVLNAGADIIHAIQAGFIGTWGEWYYSSNFGDQGTVSAQNISDRNAVISSLLTKLDSRIFVLLRYVGSRQTYLGTSTANPGGSDAPRLGFHDDAFLANYGDYGTYTTFTNQSESFNRSYVAAVNNVPNGGESATASDSANSTWSGAQPELSARKWSFLNPNYHPDVISSWGQTNNDTAARNLGYRLRLTTSTIAASATGGATTNVVFTVVNDGYNAPVRNRPVNVILDDGAGHVYTTAASVDIRNWAPGSSTDVTVPITAPPIAGTYNTYLALPDPSASLASNPLYNIQLANTGIYNSTTGRHNMGQAMAVTATSGGTGATVTDNGDGTSTATNVTDNGDGTSIATGITDNGDGSSGTSTGTPQYSGSAAFGGSGSLTANGSGAASGSLPTPVIVQSAKDGASGTRSSATVVLPTAPTAGNVLVAWVAYAAPSSGRTVTAPSGWTQLQQTGTSVTKAGQAVFIHTVQAGDSATTVFTIGGGDYGAAIVVEVGTVRSTVDGSGLSGETNPGGTVTITSGNAGVNNGLVLGGATWDANPGTVTATNGSVIQSAAPDYHALAVGRATATTTAGASNSFSFNSGTGNPVTTSWVTLVGQQVNFSTSAALSGSGTLTNTSAVRTAGTAAFTGAGTAAANGGRRASDTAAFSGSGALSGASVSSVTSAVNLTGSGDLGVVGVSSLNSKFTGAGGLAVGGMIDNGSGTIGTSTGVIDNGDGTYTGPATDNGDGTGTRTATGTPRALASLTASGTGTTALTVRPSIAVTVNATGSGSLATVSSGSTAVNAALTGSGALTIANAIRASGTATFTGNSSLTGVGFSGGGAAANMSGTGGLATGQTVKFVQAVALASDGSLAVIAVPKFSGNAAFGGSGSLTNIGGPVGGAMAAFTGSGTLVTPGGRSNFSRGIAFTGEGALNATANRIVLGGSVVNLTGTGGLGLAPRVTLGTSAALVGAGSLNAVGLPTRSDSVAFSGGGVMTVAGRRQFNYHMLIAGFAPTRAFYNGEQIVAIYYDNVKLL